MRLLGFKSLVVEDGLFSPLFPLPWEKEKDPLMGEIISAHAPPNHIEAGWGIHAGAYPLAKSYLKNGRQLFLVAPHPEANVKHESGCWRADHAFIVDRVVSLRKAASLILASYQAGEEQLDCVVSWAAAVLWRELPTHQRANLQQFRLQITQQLVCLRPALRAMLARAAGNEGLRWIVVQEGDTPPVKADWRISVGYAWPVLQEAID